MHQACCLNATTSLGFRIHYMQGGDSPNPDVNDLTQETRISTYRVLMRLKKCITEGTEMLQR